MSSFVLYEGPGRAGDAHGHRTRAAWVGGQRRVMRSLAHSCACADCMRLLQCTLLMHTCL